MFQGSFKLRSNLRHAQKTLFCPPRPAERSRPLYKNLAKINSCRFTIQEPIFSVSNQNFKAATMGAVAAIALFFAELWPTQPYPAPAVLHWQYRASTQ